MTSNKKFEVCTRFGHGVTAAVEVMAQPEFSEFKAWYIVGGMVRDTRLGQVFKDIDVFVPVGPPGVIDHGSASLLKAVRRFFLIAGEYFEINVIFMRGEWTLEQLVRRCDTGICQAGYDPRDGRFFFTPAFEADYSDNTLTVTRETRSSHLDKLRKRWPDRLYQNPMNYSLDEPWSFHYVTETAQAGRFDKIPEFENIGKRS